ncbi:phospholipase [Rivularia sp. IAM M-261]|nr:phospholipase [Rivularia sp. IAM M-261]
MLHKRKRNIKIPIAFQGGGVRGTAYIGAITALEELGIYPCAVSGSSAGAIVAAFVASGFTADEMLILMNDKDFSEFLDPVCKIPVLRLLIAYLQKGCFKGNNFHEWVESNLRIKLKKSQPGSLPTFNDINIPLIITATNITHKKLVVASQKNTLSLPIADAVRMSMSLPFIFVPVRVSSCEIVDGGVTNNFPCRELRELISDKPILGFRLQTEENPSYRKSWFDFIGSLMESAISAATHSQEFTVENLHTIHLPTLGVGVADFHISREKKMQLFEAGYNATLAYFNTDEGQRFLEKCGRY